MAWENTLQDASFRGVPFLCQQVQVAGQRAVASNELPYRAGAEVEDLNIGARRIRLRAFFFGDDYEDELKAFMDAIEAPGVADLVHPIRGPMSVIAEGWTEDHDAEYVDCAIVSVSFIEDTPAEEVFSESSAASETDAITTRADEATDAADDALARYVDGLGGLPDDMPRATLLDDAFSQAGSFIGKILDVTGSVGLLLSDLAPLLYPRAYSADLDARIDRAFQGLPFADRSLAYQPSTSTSAAVAQTAAALVADFQTVRTHLNPASIVLKPLATVPTLAQLADVARVQAHAQAHAAAAVAEAAAIVLAGELDKPLLNRSDIEQLTGQTRACIQVAIDSARAALDAEGRGMVSAALAALAYQVQEAARAVINQRPPLVRRLAPVSGPLRLIAHAFYGDATRAAELASLNSLGRKVLVDRGDTLNAYAR